MDAAGNDQRNQHGYGGPKKTSGAVPGKTDPKRKKSSDDRTDDRKKAHGIAHGFLCPVRTRHGDLGIHGKCDKKTPDQVHNGYTPFLTSGIP